MAPIKINSKYIVKAFHLGVIVETEISSYMGQSVSDFSRGSIQFLKMNYMGMM